MVHGETATIRNQVCGVREEWEGGERSREDVREWGEGGEGGGRKK